MPLCLWRWVDFCQGGVWDRLQSCDGPFPAISQAHTYTHQGHMPRGKAALWDAFGELSSGGSCPSGSWKGYVGSCLDMFMLVLALCWQKNLRPVQANSLALICLVLVLRRARHIHDLCKHKVPHEQGRQHHTAISRSLSLRTGAWQQTVSCAKVVTDCCKHGCSTLAHRPARAGWLCAPPPLSRRPGLPCHAVAQGQTGPACQLGGTGSR